MKKTVFTLVAFLSCTTILFAQQEDLKAAATSLEKKDYAAALDAINKAKKAVSELMADNLASVLPAKFGDYVMEKSTEPRGTDMGGVSLVRVYRKPKQQATSSSELVVATDPVAMAAANPMMNMGLQEEFKVEISTNMMRASEVMNAHSASENGSTMGSNLKAYRVKGYRAVLRESSGSGPMGASMGASEEAQAVVGSAFISVSANGMKEKGQAEKLLELIDMEKLVGIIGK